MRSIESKAKTMEEAVSLGLEQLGVSFEDVNIDILDEGHKGFLGLLGAKPVVVRLTVKENAEETNVLKDVKLGLNPEKPKAENPPVPPRQSLPGKKHLLKSPRPRRKNPPRSLRRKKPPQLPQMALLPRQRRKSSCAT